MESCENCNRNAVYAYYDERLKRHARCEKHCPEEYKNNGIDDNEYEFEGIDEQNENFDEIDSIRDEFYESDFEIEDVENIIDDIYSIVNDFKTHTFKKSTFKDVMSFLYRFKFKQLVELCHHIMTSLILKGHFTDKIKDAVFLERYICQNSEKYILSGEMTFNIAMIISGNINCPILHKNSKWTYTGDMLTIAVNALDIRIPSTVEKLFLMGDFNDKVILHKGIRVLAFGDSFNKEIEIPPTVKILHFGKSFDRKIVLNGDLDSLTVGENFKSWINVGDYTIKKMTTSNIAVPSCVEHLIYNGTGELMQVQNNVHRLEIKYWNKRYFKIMNRVQNLHIENSSDIVYFDNNNIISRLTFGDSFDQKVLFPTNVVIVKFGKSFNQDVVLSDLVKEVQFGGNYNGTVKIPKNSLIERIYIGEKLVPKTYFD